MLPSSVACGSNNSASLDSETWHVNSKPTRYPLFLHISRGPRVVLCLHLNHTHTHQCNNHRNHLYLRLRSKAALPASRSNGPAR